MNNGTRKDCFWIPALCPTQCKSLGIYLTLPYLLGEDFWESLGQKGHPASPSWRKSVLTIHWKNWCWSWNLNTLVTWCKELTQLKRPWCWERLRAGGEGDDRGWDGWMASPIQWTWVWASSRSWWNRNLVGCSPWDHTTESLNWQTDLPKEW